MEEKQVYMIDYLTEEQKKAAKEILRILDGYSLTIAAGILDSVKDDLKTVSVVRSKSVT